MAMQWDDVNGPRSFFGKSPVDIYKPIEAALETLVHGDMVDFIPKNIVTLYRS